MTEMRFAYTLAEVSQMTGIPERTLRDRIKRIPHRRLSNKAVVMTTQDVEAMLEQFAYRPPAPAGVDPEVVRIDKHRQRTAARLGARLRGRVA